MRLFTPFAALRAGRLTETALDAAGRQHIGPPGERLAARTVPTLAAQVLALNRKVPEANKAIAARSRDQQDFVVITSMPGLGMSLGAEFSATTGGGMAVFGTPGPRVGFCGVA